MFDYAKLRGRIVEKYHTCYRFAEALGIGRVMLSRKLNNKVGFTGRDIEACLRLLDINPSEVGDYFFTKQVHNREL